MKRKTAAPPSTIMIGAPAAAAKARRRTHIHPGDPSSSDGRRPIVSPSRSPAAATLRPVQPGEARPARRRAISAKPAGRTTCDIHACTPAASRVPMIRSSNTRVTAPTHRTAATAADTVAEVMSQNRCPRSSSRLPVASPRSRPSRAASAAPSSATHIVNCRTNTCEPGRPYPDHGRTTILDQQQQYHGRERRSGHELFSCCNRARDRAYAGGAV